jgi:hypothetical protein
MIRELTKEEQEKLLELLLVCIMYLSVIGVPDNPFVKFLGKSDKEKVLDVLTATVNNLDFLIPLLDDLNFETKEVSSEKIDLSKFE